MTQRKLLHKTADWLWPDHRSGHKRAGSAQALEEASHCFARWPLDRLLAVLFCGHFACQIQLATERALRSLEFAEAEAETETEPEPETETETESQSQTETETETDLDDTADRKSSGATLARSLAGSRRRSVTSSRRQKVAEFRHIANPPHDALESSRGHELERASQNAKPVQHSKPTCAPADSTHDLYRYFWPVVRI